MKKTIPGTGSSASISRTFFGKALAGCNLMHRPAVGPRRQLASGFQVKDLYVSGSGRRRQDAELAQQAEGIHEDPGVLDTATL
jgi:hypothetical protein